MAVLQTEQKLQPYAHEWVRPIPLMIRRRAWPGASTTTWWRRPWRFCSRPTRPCWHRPSFNLEWLDELAIDPRAYDFDHPANKRPNYHFGQWDPHHIDNSGRYRRYVVPQMTLGRDVGSRRSIAASSPYAEVLFEAAAVLAGTILMASGISGSGPGAYDSTVTLSTLVPQVAAYRDAFYERLLAGMTARMPNGSRPRPRPCGSPSARRGSI